MMITISGEEKERIATTKDAGGRELAKPFSNPNVEALVAAQIEKAAVLYKKGSSVDSAAAYQELKLDPIQAKLGSKEEGTALLCTFHYKGGVYVSAVEWIKTVVTADDFKAAKWFRIKNAGQVLPSVLALEDRMQYVNPMSIYTDLRTEML